MDNLADLLAKLQPEEPPEINVIKSYVDQHFHEKVGVLVRERDIVVTVRSSALAGALRMHAYTIQERLKIDTRTSDAPKRLVFRIGSS